MWGSGVRAGARGVSRARCGRRGRAGGVTPRATGVRCLLTVGGSCAVQCQPHRAPMRAGRRGAGRGPRAAGRAASTVRYLSRCCAAHLSCAVLCPLKSAQYSTQQRQQYITAARGTAFTVLYCLGTAVDICVLYPASADPHVHIHRGPRGVHQNLRTWTSSRLCVCGRSVCHVRARRRGPTTSCVLARALTV